MNKLSFFLLLLFLLLAAACSLVVEDSDETGDEIGGEYTLTFSAPDATSGPDPSSKIVTYGDSYGSLASVSRTGYGLSGWFTESDGSGTQITEESIVETAADHTLYAGWTTDSYKLSFSANGGSGSMSDIDLAYNSVITLPSNQFSPPTGYGFGGWATAADGTVAYSDGASYTMDAADTELFVRWYDAFWAQCATDGTYESTFTGVAVDGSGNVYAAGEQYSGAYTYGTGVSVTGAFNGYNMVLIKYDSSGTAQWARSVSPAADESRFTDATVDSSGNVYVAGHQDGDGLNTYGNGITVTGSYNSDNSILKI